MIVHYTMGGVYFENQQYEKAEEAYKAFIKTYPYFPEVHNLLAVVYAAQKRFDKVIEALEEEIRVNPYHSLAHLNLGQIYWYEFKNREKALYHLKIALIVDPFLPDRVKIKRLVQQLGDSPS
jgi:tetratricopeptide (TPR) repeat protein